MNDAAGKHKSGICIKSWENQINSLQLSALSYKK